MAAVVGMEVAEQRAEVTALQEYPHALEFVDPLLQKDEEVVPQQDEEKVKEEAAAEEEGEGRSGEEEKEAASPSTKIPAADPAPVPPLTQLFRLSVARTAQQLSSCSACG